MRNFMEELESLRPAARPGAPPDEPPNEEAPATANREGLQELNSEIKVTVPVAEVKLSSADYVRHGWSLVPIPAGKKGPTHAGWNRREQCIVPSTWRGNVGLAHAFSSTCAIDIDDLEKATAWLAERNVDLAALLEAPDAVMISSGRPNRAKLLYRLATPLASKKVVEGKQNIVDFRCSNAKGTTVQDVLPPSIHPDTGKPYEWVYGDDLVADWRSLPDIPPAMLALWQSLLAPGVTNTADAPRVGLDELRDLLLQHDPDCDRDTWVKRMAAVHHETRGSADGLALAIEWSSRGAKFAGRGDVERVWRSFSDTGERLITAASLRVDQPCSLDDIDVIPEQPKAVTPTERPNLAFTRNKKRKILAVLENLGTALRSPEWCGFHLGFDTFHDEVMFAPYGTEEWQTLSDEGTTAMMEAFQRSGFLPIPRETMRNQLSAVARERKFDSAQDWLGKLVWDGTPRVERFLADYCGAEDSPYTRSVSLYWWTAHAGRVLEPGCKADMVPILVGVQGVGKSTGVAAIVPSPEYHVEINLAEQDENLSRRMRGRLIGEINELRGLGTREIEEIKALVVRTHEEWVPKYREFHTKFARRLVLVGTTNSQEFLADETGNRRWLPVEVKRVRVDRIQADRAQLWAEAAALFAAGGISWRGAEELAPAVHEKHRVTDSWEQLINRWYDGGHPDDLGGASPSRRGKPFTSSEVQSGALGIQPHQMTKGTDMRVGKILRGMGFSRRVIRIDGRNTKVWAAS